MKKNSILDSPAPASEIGHHLKDSQNVTLEEADQQTAETVTLEEADQLIVGINQSGDSGTPLSKGCITPDSTKHTREPEKLTQSSDGTITQPPKKKRYGR